MTHKEFADKNKLDFDQAVSRAGVALMHKVQEAESFITPNPYAPDDLVDFQATATDEWGNRLTSHCFQFRDEAEEADPQTLDWTVCYYTFERA